MPSARACRCLLAALIGVSALLGALPGGAEPEPAELRLGTTTTTDNSGLIAHLLPAFETDSGYRVRAIATGSGRALKLLANGDVDIVLTHAPPLEAELLANGQAVNPRAIMYNDFILVGPQRDPASAADSIDVLAALRAIATSEQRFISRADRSGTDLREQALWAAAGIEPRGEWYREAGQGMGKTLQIAAELDAYTLVDRGTWLAYAQSLPLRIVVQGSELLFNRYSVLSANPTLHPHTNQAGARRLTEWLTSEAAKRRIREFTINGQQLFVPLL